MYFMIKYSEKDDQLNSTTSKNVNEFNCWEWVIKADSKEDAEKTVQQELNENEVIISIEEIPVEECIEREMKDILREIYRQYKVIKYDYEKMTVREYNQVFKHFEDSLDEQYEAVKLAVAQLRILRRIKRVVDIDKMTWKAVYNAVNRLTEAETEEEFDKIFNEIKEENK